MTNNSATDDNNDSGQQLMDAQEQHKYLVPTHIGMQLMKLLAIEIVGFILFGYQLLVHIILRKIYCKIAALIM